VRNDASWYAAFPQIKAGDAYFLAPGERVVLW
jgi:predicted metalloendopeptidase